MGLLDQTLWVVGLIVLVIVVAPLIYIFVRRRWLDAKGGVFDCDLRVAPFRPGLGWMTGVALYSGEEIVWYRTFSLSLAPRVRLRRSVTEMIGHRDQEPAEQTLLLADQGIVQLATAEGSHRVLYELALSEASATGLMAWLEASPPGLDYVRNV